MRSWEDNFLKEAIYKKKMYEEYIHSDVICAYDDDQTIIDMWSDLGIPCFKVYVID